jgi:ethanolamine ammonia-lyase large subunit
MHAKRRTFLAAAVATAACSGHSKAVANILGTSASASLCDRQLPAALTGEGLVEYIQRIHGQWNAESYKQLLGAANEYKEGDAIVGVAAADQQHRQLARTLLANTRLKQIDAKPLLADQLYVALSADLDTQQQARTADWTFQQLKIELLTQDQESIKRLSQGLSSEVIGCVVKLMDNSQLTQVGAKIFNTLPGTNIGAKGYLGARIQPNSPTDNGDDIRWQVFNAWSYAVGDVLLGTNPVSSELAAVAGVESVLQELLICFDLADTLPHCVLSHIDVQSQVEQQFPGRTALWFQSIAGSDAANATFDVTLDKLLHYAQHKPGPYGLYFETGQGADFTNGHSAGFDMVIHESRKYGLARLLSRKFAAANSIQGRPWVHVNDVAGFIGPEVFRSRDQLVRCCLEDIVMGKLHGLCIGLDVCSTLHMSISLDDLDWCLDQLVPACPAYLMALPTKIDPMLGYLTTGYQDHVRLREKFGVRVNDKMWEFFQSLRVIDGQGTPTENFGKPAWVYLQYRKRQGDTRLDSEILAEAEQQMAGVRSRGVFLASGFGQRPSQLRADLSREIATIYEDAKTSIWAELTPQLKKSRANAVHLATLSKNREDYILHPASGEKLAENSLQRLHQLRQQYNARYQVQIVISDGLNALAINDEQQLAPFVMQLIQQLQSAHFAIAPTELIVEAGRVRAGYQIGELLFGDLPGLRGLIHIIGERPGTGHRTFSAYMSCPAGNVWSSGKVDHDRTRVVAGIANTALHPEKAAVEAANIFTRMWQG